MNVKRLFFGMLFMVVLMAYCGVTADAVEVDSSLPYIVSDGTVYYESSYGFGSGRHGIVKQENPYTTDPCYAGINGYSYLDEFGRVLCSNYEESSTDIQIPSAPETSAKLFLHFKSTNYRNGWVDSDSVIANTLSSFSSSVPAEQAPEEIIDQIETEIQKDLKTTILIDYSGSMDDNQREVVNLLGTLEFQEDVNIIVFASTYEVITHDQLKSNDFFVGNSTRLYQALNKTTSLGTEQLILISDLQTYEDVPLQTNSSLLSVIIYDPNGLELDPDLEKDFTTHWPNAEVTRIKIK